MAPAHSHNTKLPCVTRSSPSPDQIGQLIAALEEEQRQIEEDRQILRLKMAEVEWKLEQLTSQQAELQKLQVAINLVLKYLSPNKSPADTDPESARLNGLAGAKVAGTC